MTDWGRNSFWRNIVDRLRKQESGTRFASMGFADGNWHQQTMPGQESPPALLQGRLLVVDVTDKWISVYPLGLRGRFRFRLGFALDGGEDADIPTEIVYGVGCATLRSPTWQLDIRVSPTLPVLEATLSGAVESEAWILWQGGHGREKVGTQFAMPASFDQDVVVERNNSTAPDPFPLPDLERAGVLTRHLPGRVVVALAANETGAHRAMEEWEQRRGEEREYWDGVSGRLSVSVPDAAITRQASYSVHNSLFSRSYDEAGREIFVHGRRDRGYADASHLHQSFQMHFPALAAGEGKSVRDELIAYCALQDENGWIERAPRPLRGTSRYVGRYTNTHLLMAAERYLAWTGDSGLFALEVESTIDGSTAPIAERVDRAARDLVGHSFRGLIEPCGWADAWNPEVRAQGQASAAAVIGLRAWARASGWLGRSRQVAEFAGHADAISESMRDILYDESSGIVAEHLFDDGVEGGTADDFWAHTQIWAALAGVVDDGRGLDIVERECLDNGVSIAPESAFDKGYVAESTDATDSLPVESTATWLLARWPEVTHLYALAELERGRPDAALAAVRGQLPQTLHELDPVCAPFYYAEKYLFPGTVPWLCTWAGDPSLIETTISGFFGVRAAFDVLEIRPRLPTSWRGGHGRVTFMWRGAPVQIELDPEFSPTAIDLDPVLLAPPTGTGVRVVRFSSR
jgi:hypothetical protein